MTTRGFLGSRLADAVWVWPPRRAPLGVDSIATVLGVAARRPDRWSVEALGPLGVTAAFRSRRILVGETPNLTPAVAVT